jgi:diguanylate cyclase (GGDEF)-like protein/PAS domain S-box-containing protein
MKEIPAKTVLLVEDDEQDARSIRNILDEQDSQSFELTHMPSLTEAEICLASHSFDLVLLELDLPDAQGLDAVRRVRAIAPRVSIILLSCPDGETTAMRAIEEGAQDYLIKGQIEPRELMRALRNTLDRKSIEESLFQEKERAQVTLDCIGDAVICTDLIGNISFLNPVAERMTGWSSSEALGQPLADAFRIMDATTRITTPNPMAKAVRQDRSGSLPSNCILVRHDGNELFIEDSVAPIHDRGGLVAGSVLVFRDVTAARALAAQITKLAERDSLTGLPNRLLLNDRIGQAIARCPRDGGQIAVLFLDLDDFKHINDSLGHSVGDRLLQSVANRLTECVRTPDTVSRQGGDEFTAVLQVIGHPEDAAIAANRILEAIAEIHSIDGHDLHITASIGVSIYPNDGRDAETLIKNADTAMYQAKEGGRHSYRFFEPEMNVRAVDRQSIEEDLRCALRRHELTLHYQPKIDLKTGAITGAEALLRWTHPSRGSVPPLQFIPIAEDSGMILPIGAWVLREACKQARAWTDAGLPFLTMAVNVSAVQFRNKNFISELFAILRETGMNPRFLELEVTESVLMEHPETTAPILKALREEGVRVSVDDFGTGYSSLSYLQLFPIDALKIDQSFIRGIAANPGETAIVRAIIAMGQNLHLRVIAEGVETPEDLAFLKENDCDEAQGYYFSRPVPAKNFAALLEQSSVNLSADASATPCN